MANISEKVQQIRQAVYGKDVRESIASGIETINQEVENTTSRQNNLETTFQQLIINAGNSNAEIVDARVKADNTVFSTLKNRLNSMDEDIKNISTKQGDIANLVTSSKDNIVNAINEVKSQANSNTTAIQNIGNASPKGVYATVQDLQTAKPNGDTGIYVVTADGKWYYWNGSVWTAGGQYQSTGIADNSIKYNNLSILNKNMFKNINCFGIDDLTWSGSNYNGGQTSVTNINNIQIVVPSGQTGYNSYINGVLNLPIGSKIQSLLVNRTIGILIEVECTSNIINKIGFGTNVKTSDYQYPTNVQLSKETVISDNKIYCYMTYLIPSNVVEVKPYFQVQNNSTLSEQGTVKLNNIQIFDLNSTSKIITALFENNFNRHLQTTLDITNLFLLTGESLNGGQVNLTTKTITIPVGSSGLNSYLGYKIKKSDIGINTKITFEFSLSLANIVTNNISINVSVKKQNGTWLYNQGTNITKTLISGNVYKFVCEYTINSDDETIQPFIQINSNNPTATTEQQIILNSCILKTVPNNLEEYLTFKTNINNLQLSMNNNTVITINKTVKKDGTGDYISIVQAINSITDASKNKIYNIFIYPGTYNLYDELGGDIWLQTVETNTSERQGLNIPDYVNLIGVGDKSQIILNFEIPQSKANVTNTTRTSTLNACQNSTIKNLTLKGKNCRYTVHSETNGNSTINTTLICENVDFIYYAPDSQDYWQWGCAWGEGTGSGCIRLFKNCKFITYHSGNAPYIQHDNLNFSVPTYHEFENCEFITLNESLINAIRFQSLGSGTINRVLIKNCKFNGRLVSNIGGSQTEATYIIEGSGNSIMPHYVVGNYATIRFSDEVLYVKNVGSSTIQRGNPCKFVDFNKVDKATQISDFCGFTLEEIPAGGYGYIKIKGYMPIDITNNSIGVGKTIGNYILF